VADFGELKMTTTLTLESNSISASSSPSSSSISEFELLSAPSSSSISEFEVLSLSPPSSSISSSSSIDTDSRLIEDKEAEAKTSLDLVCFFVNLTLK
jgi:hypothetical protein